MAIAVTGLMRFACLRMFAVGVALVALPQPAYSSDFVTACESFGSAQVVFVGRAGPQVTRRVSAEAEIEKARVNLARAEAELARVATADQKTRLLFLAYKIHAESDLEAAKIHFPPPIDVMVTPMTVDTAYSGAPGSPVFMASPAAMGYSATEAAGWTKLEAGRSYLIYGRRRYPWAPEVIEFSRPPQTLDEADADLRFLNLAAFGGQGASLYGKLTFRTENRSEPMAGVSIHVSSGGQVIDARTREDGSFLVTGVQLGRVELAPSLPPNLTISREGDSLIHVLEHNGCVPWSLQAVLNGRVRGTVLTERGTPSAGTQVDLVSAPSERGHRSNAYTNESGEFEFSAVPPGSYYVGVNLSRSANATLPYPPTYFPGTADRDAATLVRVGQGDEHDAVNFALGEAFSLRLLELHTDTGGRPWTRVFVCLSTWDGEASRFEDWTVASYARYSSTGDPVRLSLMAGARYRVRTRVATSAGWLESAIFAVEGTGGLTKMTLKNSPPAKTLPDNILCADSPGPLLNPTPTHPR